MQRENDLPNLISAIGTDLSSRIFTDYLDPNDRLRFGLTGATYWAFFQQNKRQARLENLIHLLIQQGLNYRLDLFPVHELSDAQINTFIWICSHPFTFNKEKIDYCQWLASDEMQTSQSLVAWRIAIFCLLTINGIELNHPEMSHTFVTEKNLHVFKSLFCQNSFQLTGLLNSEIDLTIAAVAGEEGGENKLLCKALTAHKLKPLAEQMFAALADAPSTTPLSKEEKRPIAVRYRGGLLPLTTLSSDDRRSFKWACPMLRSASSNELALIWDIVTKRDNDNRGLQLVYKGNTDQLLKGLMTLNHLRSIPFDLFRDAVSSETDVVTEDDFKSFMALLFRCFPRVLKDLDYAVNVDDSLNRLKSQNFLRILYAIKKDCDTGARGVPHTEVSIQIALLAFNRHPTAFRKLTDSMMATIHEALTFEAVTIRSVYEFLPITRIRWQSSVLRPNSLLWELHEDTRSALVSGWPHLRDGTAFLLQRLLRVIRSKEAINRIKSLSPDHVFSFARKGWCFNEDNKYLTELDLLLMLPRPIFDEVLTALQTTPLTDIIPSLCRI